VRSNTALLTKTSIRYRQVKYTDDGLQDAKDITEKEFAKVEQSGKGKLGDDIIWTRHLNSDNKYAYTEAQIVGTELQDLLKAKLAHDPRLRFSNDNTKNVITMLSPFEPLLHIWSQLEKLAETECDAEEWSSLKGQFEELREKSKMALEKDALSPLENVEDRLRKAKKDLTTLLEHIRKTQEVSSYFSGLNASKTSRAVQFEYLWTLFHPASWCTQHHSCGNLKSSSSRTVSATFALRRKMSAKARSESGHLTAGATTGTARNSSVSL
jgi:hypothetical protein